MTITLVTPNLATIWQIKKKTYYKENFFLRHHQNQVSWQGKHFPIHLDEARSVGLVKACVPQKIYSVPEKISYKHII